MLVFALTAGALVYLAVVYRSANSPLSSPPAAAMPGPAPVFAGAVACASCHAAQVAAWKSSQHALAMQHASEASVLGDFEHAKFGYAGVTSIFFKRDGGFWVNTDGPDGKLHDYEIKFTYGVSPLQQYLVEFPDGRIQALSIAWDSRPKAQGGQRWFHLYPHDRIRAGDRLHWTGIDQNWNHQCATCHSTDVRKNFDPKTNRFATTWSEINVSCEACHGPGSNHVTWAKKEGDWKRFAAGKGLPAALTERSGVTWTIAPDTGNAQRSRPRATRVEIDTCGACHARRGQFADAMPGQPLGDSFQASLLEPGLYYPDGQQRDEVYNYGSFLQSRMYAKGVTCSDCHDPHSLQTRGKGNAVCAQCHAPAKYDGSQHHHHLTGSTGASCIACHMPATTYMVLDPRHDHSFRIPRPDRSVSMGAPNACTQCHADRKPEWALEALRKWYPASAQGYQTFAEALQAGAVEGANARSALRDVVADRSQSAIARASAAAQLARYPGLATVGVLKAALGEDDALVRTAVAEALGGMEPAVRLQYLPRLLDDPVRSVRMAAARALVPVQLPEDRRAPFERALREYVDAQRYNADRPESHVNLGSLYAERGDAAAAEDEYREALRIDPGFVPAAVNLADLYRRAGGEKQAEGVLRAAMERQPRSAPLYYALGLSLARQKRMPEALKALAEAVRFAPADSSYAYVYGVALNSAGKAAEALKVLEAAHRRFPGNAEILRALATMERDRGGLAAARTYAKQLADLTPDDPEAARLLRYLEPR